MGVRLQQAAADATGDPQARLIALGSSYVNWALEDPAVFRLAFRTSAGNGALRPGVPCPCRAALSSHIRGSSCPQPTWGGQLP